MTSTKPTKPVEYHEDEDAVIACVEALAAVEKQFGTSAFIDAVDELAHDDDYQARARGARPLTTAWVRETLLHAVRDDEDLIRHVEQEEIVIAEPFPVRKPSSAVLKSSPLLILSLGGMSLGAMLIGIGLTLHSLGLA